MRSKGNSYDRKRVFSQESTGTMKTDKKKVCTSFAITRNSMLDKSPGSKKKRAVWLRGGKVGK